MTLRKGGGLGGGGLGSLGLGGESSSFIFQGRGSLRASAVLTGRGNVVDVNPTGLPAMPGIKIQIALTGTIWTGSNWVEVTPFVTAFSTRRGRQHELQRCEAGQATLAFNNFDGRFSPWSTNSPFYNHLPPTDSNPTAGLGTWTASAAAGEYRSGLLGQGLLGWSPLGSGLLEVEEAETAPTLARTTTTPRYGQYAWILTAAAAGSMSMVSDSETACTAKRTYTAYAWVRCGPGAAPRSATVSVLWKNSSGTVIQTTTGAAQLETAGWQTAPVTVRGVCPAGAVTKDVEVTIATAAVGEEHVVACLGISDVTWALPAAVNQGWCVGQTKPLRPFTPIRITAKRNGITYPVFAGAVASWVPKYGRVLGGQAVQAYDFMHVLGTMPLVGNALPGLQRQDGAALQWMLGTSRGTTTVFTSAGGGHTGSVSGTLDALWRQDGGLVNTTTNQSIYIYEGSITGTLGQSAEGSTIEFLLKPSGSPTPLAVVTWGTGTARFGLALGASATDDRTVLVVSGTSEFTFGGSKPGRTVSSGANCRATSSTLTTVRAVESITVGMAVTCPGHSLVLEGTVSVSSVTATARTVTMSGSARIDATNLTFRFQGAATPTTAQKVRDTSLAPWLHVAFTRGATGEGTLYLTGDLVWSGTLSTALGSVLAVGPAGAFLQCVALYDRALTAAEIALHYQAALVTGFPDELSGVQILQILQACGVPSSAIGTIDTGSVECIPPLITKGQTQVLSVVQTSENTEQGMLYCSPAGPLEFATADAIAALSESVATFANDGTPTHIPPLDPPVPSCDDLTLWNSVAVGIQGAEETETSSVYFSTTPSSIDTAGARALTGYTGMYFKNAATAQALADTLCTRYAKPKTRVRSVACSNTATAGKWLPTMLSFRLLTYVTVWWQPYDGSESPFSQKSQIEQITHVVTKTTWTTALALMPTTIS